MQYRCSVASDFSSVSIPARGTPRAFSGERLNSLALRGFIALRPVDHYFYACRLFFNHC